MSKIDESILKTSKELRESLGMNMTRFSEFTGIPYRTIQNWESGMNKCPDYVLAMLNELIESYISQPTDGIHLTKYTY